MESKAKKRVLFVAHSVKMSGANKSLADVLTRLKKRYDVTVLVNKKSGDLVDFLKKQQIKHIYAPFGWSYIHPRNNWVKKIYRYTVDWLTYYYGVVRMKISSPIKPGQFDLIYTNTSVIDAGARLAKKYQIPHILHVREYIKEDFGLVPIISAKKRSEQLQDAAAIITISQSLAKKYQRMVKAAKIRTIYNGFDVKKLTAPEHPRVKNRPVTVLVAGQILPAKGQADAVKAVADLYRQGYQVKLILAGDADPDYLNAILQNYTDHEKWLELPGYVNKMYELRNKVDIELVCSRSEAFGRTTIEGMLHHLPMIGSAAGGTTELIVDGKTGFLYQKNRIGTLTEKLRELIERPALAQAFTTRAYDFAKNFTIENTVNQISEQIDEVLKNEK